MTIGHLLGKIHQGDCLPFMRSLPDKCVDLVLTDPIWPNPIPEWRNLNPQKTFDDVIPEIFRISNSAIFIVGCNSDIRFFSNIPNHIPFLRSVWLEYAVPGMRGLILYSGNIAYVFGHPNLPNGKNLFPGKKCAPSSNVKDKENTHPCPNRIEHSEFLVAGFSNEKDVIFDPFMGSGTTAVACERIGRKWFGCELEPKYCAIAQTRIDAERAQLKLF
jgi:DNA modification methylase